MRTVLDLVAEVVDQHGLGLRRSIPCAPDHLLLVLTRSDRQPTGPLRDAGEQR
jgi:hypothetical protein